MCHRLDDDNVNIDELIARCETQIDNSSVVLANHEKWHRVWTDNRSFLSRIMRVQSPHEFKLNAIKVKLTCLRNTLRDLQERKSNMKPHVSNKQKSDKKMYDYVTVGDKFSSHHDDIFEVVEVGPYTMKLSNTKVVSTENIKNFLRNHTRITGRLS